eukprot:TRINITY_DN5145_c0_g1_i1.p1 TRINITY_DN5145_c0_g1~~TRINITY_DN5145_c0_g1_i1.p1  ORF type:complete len:351 (+),score=55.88 TRINITY_DN5145_c0_g1_i1:42-1055(+)
MAVSVQTSRCVVSLNLALGSGLRLPVAAKDFICSGSRMGATSVLNSRLVSFVDPLRRGKSAAMVSCVRASLESTVERVALTEINRSQPKELNVSSRAFSLRNIDSNFPVRNFGLKSGRGSTLDVTSDDRQLQVRHILVGEDQQELLEEIKKKIQLEGGEAFSQLAKEHSLCPSRSEGGVIGWISRGQTVKEFEEASFNSAVGESVSVQTRFGWHLLQVMAEREVPVVRQLAPEKAAQLLEEVEEGEVQLIDVREPHEISIASIRGFQAFPLSEFQRWAPSMSEELDMDKDTLVICHHGVRSNQAAHWLLQQGFNKVYNIVGGIDAWSREVDESIPRY